MTSYTVVTGEGGELASGVPAQEIERVAQAHADRIGETVYYSEMGGSDLDEDDDENLGVAVEPRS